MDVRLRDGTRIKIASRLSLLRGCKTLAGITLAKRAAIGGEQEQQFEQSFASLAYSYIADKAPALLDYLVGFQLVDRNDDNTKTVGIFGFKIGNTWAYAPVFFINGDLKGHELLYLKNQDSFVPMKENWINYVVNRRPHILGEGVPGSANQLGILQPDIQALSQPPETGKFAALRRPRIKDWAKSADLLKFLGKSVTSSPREKDAQLQDRLTLRRFLAEDPSLVKLAMDLQRSYPLLKQAFHDFYGPNLFRDCLLDCKRRLEKAARGDMLAGGKADNKSPGSESQKRKGTKIEFEHTNDRSLAREIAEDHLEENSRYYDHLEKMEKEMDSGKRAAADSENSKKLEILTDQVITKNTPEMTESERERLLQQGYLIRDHRNGEEVSVVYNTQIEMDLMNPDQTGRFEVLTDNGEFEDCLVIHHPHGEKGHEDFVVIVRLSDSGDKKSTCNCHKSKVFVRVHPQEVKSETSAYRQWFNSLPANKDLEVGASYVVLSQSGEGTCEFEVEEDLGDGCYEVHWKSYCNYNYRRDDDPTIGSGVFPESRESCRCIRFNDREGSDFKSYNGNLYLPPEVRVIRTANSPRCRGCDKIRSRCACEYFREKHVDSPPNIKPGDLASIQLQIMQKSADSILAARPAAADGGVPANGLPAVKVACRNVPGLRPLKVWSDGSEVVINTSRMSKMAGLFCLVNRFGLREKVAKKLIQSAELGEVGRYWIKLAYPYQGELGPYAAGEGIGMPIDTSANYTGNNAYGSVPIQEYDQGRFEQVPGLEAGNTDRSVYDPMQNIDPDALRTAQNAYQQNQKEIFDTAMISNLLNAVRQDSLVDKYLGDLTKALDRLGRILFLFYWHNEEFADRYGKQDLPELEDTIRNAFEGLGDLTLFLKQKTVEPMTFGEPTLADTANN